MFVFLFFIASILFIGIFMYVIIMGPSRYHRDGLVGAIHRRVTAVPAIVGSCCCSLLCCVSRQKGRRRWKACANHVVKERNWLMVGFYVALVWPVEYLYLVTALPELRTSMLSKAVSWGLVLASELFYALAVFADPGTITPEADRAAQIAAYDAKKNTAAAAAASAAAGHSRKKSDRRSRSKAAPPPPAASSSKSFPLSPEAEYAMNRRYAIDGMLYAIADLSAGTDAAAADDDEDGDGGFDEIAAAAPVTSPRVSDEEVQFPSGSRTAPAGWGPSCQTCHVPRPARSRHCRMCNRCVRRYDHHCPWINNDVAEGTHGFFLLFLILHALSCTWAAYDLFRLIRQFLIAKRAWGWMVYLPNGGVFPLSFSHYMAIVVRYQMLNGCLLFFAFFISLVLFGFWGYQMTFALANLTMNDMNKIDDVAYYVSRLPTLDLVHREALRVRERLQEVAERKPRALLLLEAPPPPKTEPGYEEGGKRNRAYRKKVRGMVTSDLKGMYDRGAWRNLMEVMWPYASLTPERLDEARRFVKK